MDQERGLLDQVAEDGRPALLLTGIALLFSGAFAIFLSARREFLPHDIAYLGMSVDELCGLAGGRVARFMFHDRVAFGGTLIAIAILYIWLGTVPLRRGEAWAWWAFAGSGILGFGSFLAYVGYGYLDTWHGTATLALLPVFAAGLIRSRSLAKVSVSSWLRSSEGRAASPLARLGRVGLLATGAGMTLAGAAILFLGTTDVFVAEDLAYMAVTRGTLDSFNPRLVPLIAHDRAGFGGGLTTAGLLVVLCATYARPHRPFYEAISAAGIVGFGCAIIVHFIEGYTNPVHLAPAFAGAMLFAVSLTCEVMGLRVRRAGGHRWGNE